MSEVFSPGTMSLVHLDCKLNKSRAHVSHSLLTHTRQTWTYHSSKTMYEKLGSGVLLILKVVKEGFSFINFHFYICTVGLCVCAHVCAGVGACVPVEDSRYPARLLSALFLI